MIPSRNVWHPLGRLPRAPAPLPETLDQDKPPPDADALPEPAGFDEEPEPDAWDEADELAAMSDADFYRQSRAEIEGVRGGLTPSMTEAMHQPLQQRPWSPRRKRRDRHGKAF